MFSTEPINNTLAHSYLDTHSRTTLNFSYCPIPAHWSNKRLPKSYWNQMVVLLAVSVTHEVRTSQHRTFEALFLFCLPSVWKPTDRHRLTVDNRSNCHWFTLHNDSFHRLRELPVFPFTASSAFQTPSETEEKKSFKDPNYIHDQSDLKALHDSLNQKLQK